MAPQDKRTAERQAVTISKVRLSPNQRFVVEGSPSEWLSCADELKAAADQLWAYRDGGLTVDVGNYAPRTDKSPISRPCTLLLALALENVLKACLIVQDPSLVARGRLDNTMKTHNLVELAIRIPRLRRSRKQMEVLARASASLPYWGRYPIPLHAGALQREQPLDSQSKVAADQLYARVRLKVIRALGNGWGAPEGMGRLTCEYHVRNPGTGEMERVGLSDRAMARLTESGSKNGRLWPVG